MEPVSDVSVGDHAGTNSAGRGQRLRDAAPGPPRVPEVIGDTGLAPSLVSDLLVKLLGRRRAPTGAELADAACLPFGMLDDQLMELQRRRLIEVSGAPGHGRRSYTFDLTSRGRELYHDLSRDDPYAGPAPVTLEEYVVRVRRQSNLDVRVDRERVAHQLDRLVVDSELVDLLGPALNAGKPIMLHGAPGDGKTAVAEAVAGIYGEAIYVPYAVLAGGNVITLHDPGVHRDVGEEGDDQDDRPWLRPMAEYDQRYARIERPTVRVAGELTLAELDLRPDPAGGSLHAPPQMKANGGVLIVDDFGHQQVRPRELLSRWAGPLERGVDYLGLSMGARIPVPFDCRLVFCADRPPSDLLEDTFLRRVPYRIKIESPDETGWTEIFRRACRDLDVAWDGEAVDRVFHQLYDGGELSPRAWHPGEIVLHLVETARFDGVDPVLTEERLQTAADSALRGLGASAGRVL